MRLGVTGHRPRKVRLSTAAVELMRQIVVELKPDVIITGMAPGVDQEFARIAFDLQIPFIAAVPFEGQEKLWWLDEQESYRHLLQFASDVVVVSSGGYSKSKYFVRDRWVVDGCDELLAVWDGTPSGTGNTVHYAQSVGRPVVVIEPRSLVVRRL